MNNTITFEANFNGKLFNNIFGTVRLRKPRKYKVGEVYKIKLVDDMNGGYYGLAKILSISEFKLPELTNELAIIDSGFSRFIFIDYLQEVYNLLDSELEDTYFQYLIIEYEDTTRYLFNDFCF